MRQRALGILAAAILANAATSAMAEDKVFFLLPNSTTIRFESRDAPFFIEAMKKKAPQAKVIVQNAQGDPSRQQRLVEDAISQGAKVIVYTSNDSNLNRFVFDAFNKETGIEIEQVEAGSGVIFRRIQSERERPLGDIVWGVSRTRGRAAACGAGQSFMNP